MRANQIGIFCLLQIGEALRVAGQECSPWFTESLVKGNKLLAHVRLTKRFGEGIGKDQLCRDINSWDWVIQALTELVAPVVEICGLVTYHAVAKTFVMATAGTAEAVEENGTWYPEELAAPVFLWPAKTVQQITRQTPTSLPIYTLGCDMLVVLTDGPGSPGNIAHFGRRLECFCRARCGFVP